MSHKIYLDCTHTYNSGLNTGIQRVVKNIVKNAPQVAKELDAEIIPVVSVSNKYYSFYDFPKINKKNNYIKQFLKKIYTNTRTFLDLILPLKFKKILYHPSIGIFLSKSIDKMLFSKKIDLTKLVTLQSEDILILIDSTWLNNNYKQLNNLKKKNVKIVVLIYDIIPIIYPKYFTIDLIISQKDWFQKAVKYIDGYIAISNTVKNEVYVYIKNNLLPDIQKQKFDYFYLGANLSTKYEENDVAQTFKNYFKNENTYVTVSTIEPRKNHAFVLDAFDVLWSNNENFTYIIIGRIGWDTEELIKRIKSHKEYGKKLFLLDNVEDNELIYAYKNAKALIFASFAEGFGLPIIESLFYKLPVIASDIPIHKEIGDDKILYFDLSDIGSLVSIIKTQNTKSVENFAWQDWHQSTKDLILKSRKI